MSTGATEWVRRFRAGEASPVEAAEHYLALIEADVLGAFITLTPDTARAGARAAEGRWRMGMPLSAIDGVPVAMKDLSATRGVRTTFGSALYADYVPDFDVAYWARLAAAGAVLVGKTNTPEFGALPTTENLIAAPARNPYDPTRTAGGSSGGAAVALATGLVPLAEGSDGAGSIRIPASCCGVFGIKPSRGRVSEGPNFGDQMSGLATSGPMATTVEDCLLMLHAMQGSDLGDPYGDMAFGPSTPVQRVGLVAEALHAPVDKEIRTAVERVGRELEALGVVVEQADLPLDGFTEPLETVWAVGMAAVPLRDLEQVHPVVRLQVERGRQVSGVEYERARVRLHRRSRELRLAMGPYDAILLPVLPTPPKPLGFLDGVTRLEDIFAWLPYTYPFNATGQPCVAIPAGSTASGLPIGAQIVGHHGHDDDIAALARRWQERSGRFATRPA